MRTGDARLAKTSFGYVRAYAFEQGKVCMRACARAQLLVVLCAPSLARAQGQALATDVPSFVRIPKTITSPRLGFVAAPRHCVASAVCHEFERPVGMRRLYSDADSEEQREPCLAIPGDLVCPAYSTLHSVTCRSTL